MKDNPERANQRAKEWYENNKERARATRRAHYERNKAKSLKQTREWREKNPERAKRNRRNSEMIRKYRITLEEYEAILKKQGGVCAICKGPPSHSMVNFDVDHCHNSKKVRGLLCRHCNQGLGHFKDDPENLKRAVHYVRR